MVDTADDVRVYMGAVAVDVSRAAEAVRLAALAVAVLAGVAVLVVMLAGAL